MADAARLLFEPAGPARCAVLVLSGSSGRVETDRAQLLARHGAVALSLRWFGAEGQPPGICEVPLESFLPALDELAAHSDHLAVLGTSKGAEVALLLAAHDPRIRVVTALSPPSSVWANIGPGLDGKQHPYRSSWTRGGRPLAFVPYDDTWSAQDAQTPKGPAFLGMYERSLVTFADRVEAARIPVELIGADVLLSAGGDDQVWPSADSARKIADARGRSGLATRLLLGASAGHRLPLPGESQPQGGTTMARGGAPEADQVLGRRVWDELRDLLRLT